eukprot:scaffold230824_cov30-Tisochrysis_lutea.AAC.1
MRLGSPRYKLQQVNRAQAYGARTAACPLQEGTSSTTAYHLASSGQPEESTSPCQGREPQSANLTQSTRDRRHVGSEVQPALLLFDDAIANTIGDRLLRHGGGCESKGRMSMQLGARRAGKRASLEGYRSLGQAHEAIFV